MESFKEISLCFIIIIFLMIIEKISVNAYILTLSEEILLIINLINILSATNHILF